MPQIANPNDAYKAIATEPQFTNLLAQVPVKQHSYMKGFAIFCICNFIFFCTGNRGKTKSGYLFGLFLVLLFSVRMVVESVKESQGGFESALGLLSTGQWLSIPFILIGLYFVFTAQKRCNIF
jgi:prolipoprotein diacylglyceryltransferase